MSLLVSALTSERDRMPSTRPCTWEALAIRLTRHEVQESKYGRAWSPVSYPHGAVRSVANVQAIYCLVLDFDTGIGPEAFTDEWDAQELAYVVHSSFSSTPDKPKWRAVFPLETPVPAKWWDEAHNRMAASLGKGHADPACKDSSRLYFLPSHPQGAQPFTIRRIAGRHLRWQNFPRVVEETPHPRQQEAREWQQGDALKPGEDFDNRGADIALACLLRHGWQVAGEKAGYIELTRPGKSRSQGTSATFGKAAPGVLHVFTSSAAPFENDGNYNPFKVLTLLDFNGDYKACAAYLGRQGYGSPLERGRKPMQPARMPVEGTQRVLVPDVYAPTAEEHATRVMPVAPAPAVVAWEEPVKTAPAPDPVAELRKLGAEVDELLEDAESRTWEQEPLVQAALDIFGGEVVKEQQTMSRSELTPLESRRGEDARGYLKRLKDWFANLCRPTRMQDGSMKVLHPEGWTEQDEKEHRAYWRRVITHWEGQASPVLWGLEKEQG